MKSITVETKTREELKSYFVKNSVPTESNFIELIDGMLNQRDDGIAKLPEGGPLCIEAVEDEMGSKDVLHFYRDFASGGPHWILNLQSKNDDEIHKPGFNICDAQGNSRLFIESGTGNIGIGTVKHGDAKLYVAGTIKATGGICVDNDDQEDDGQEDHINADGAFYRIDGNVYLTVQDELFIRNTSPTTQNTEDNICVHFRTQKGYVGINKKDPTCALDVNGKIQATGGICVENEDQEDHINADGAFYRYKREAYITVNSNLYIREINETVPKVHFDTKNSKVGINKKNPDYALDVEGDIKASGSIQATSLSLSGIENGPDDPRLDVAGTIKATGGISVMNDTKGNHVEADGAFYRYDGEVYITVDNNLYIRQKPILLGDRNDENLTIAHFYKKGDNNFINPTYALDVNGSIQANSLSLGGTDDSDEPRLDVAGTIKATGGISVMNDTKGNHVEADGAFYRYDGEVYITVDNSLYIHKKGNADEEKLVHFDTMNGKVGINKMATEYALDVEGDIRASGSIQATSLCLGGDEEDHINKDGAFYRLNGDTYLAVRQELFIRNTNLLGGDNICVRFDTFRGRVGINKTEPPDYELDVEGDIRASGSIQATSLCLGGDEEDHINEDSAFYRIDGDVYLTVQHELFIRNTNPITEDTEDNNICVRFDTFHGKVGINKTEPPDYELDVEGNIKASGSIKATSLCLGGDEEDHINEDGAFYRIDGDAYLTVQQELFIRNTNPTTEDTEENICVHFMTKQGLVGINKKDPTCALDVNGKIQATGGICVENEDQEDHINADGAFYRYKRKAYITVNSNLYIRQLNSKKIVVRFDTQEGNIYLTGNVLDLQDDIKKHNIEAIRCGLEKIKQLQPVSFNREETPDRKRFGLLGHKVRTVIPEVVHVDKPDMPDSKHSIAYTSLIPVLIKAIQELDTKIEGLKAGHLEI